jgi:hypothetical protein
VEIAHLRGPLRRILRHEALGQVSPFSPEVREPPFVPSKGGHSVSPVTLLEVGKPSSKPVPVISKKVPRLRPVEKQNPNED